MTAMKVPLPFKMGVFKRESGDWTACSIHFFDCREDPLPFPQGKQTTSGHLNLRGFCTDALDCLSEALSELNEDKVVQKLGYTWIIKSVHIDWAKLPEKQFAVVFELTDTWAAFEKVFGKNVDDARDDSDAGGEWTPATLSARSGSVGI
ncbi:hypothetical protein TWF281_011686 [Arthrobotrys megalospora]